MASAMKGLIGGSKYKPPATTGWNMRRVLLLSTVPNTHALAEHPVLKNVKKCFLYKKRVAGMYARAFSPYRFVIALQSKRGRKIGPEDRQP